MSSIFTRPRARPPLAAVSSQQNLIAVSTEDELLAALTTLPRSDGSCYGRGISITGDISLSRSIQLSTLHSGLTISSPSSARISSRANIGTVIIADGAANLTISNLSIGQIGTTSGGVAISLIAVSADGLSVKDIFIENTSDLTHLVFFAPRGTTSAFSGLGLRVMRCYVQPPLTKSVSLFFQSLPTQCRSAIFSNNSGFTGGIGIPPLPGIVAQRAVLDSCLVSANVSLGTIDMSNFDTSGFNSICGNTLVGDIVITSTTSGNNSISGNVMNGYDINTFSTTGGNTIVGNTNVGTITNAATDAVTSNT